MRNFDSPTKVGMEADISSRTLEYFLLMAFHTLSLLYFPLLHFPLPHFQRPPPLQVNGSVDANVIAEKFVKHFQTVFHVMTKNEDIF